MAKLSEKTTSILGLQIIILAVIVLSGMAFILASEGIQDSSLNTTKTYIPPTCEKNGTLKIFNETLNSSEIEQKVNWAGEQLIEILNLYNNCSEDYQRGENCGMAFQMVKDANQVLTSEKDKYLKEAGKNSGYKTSFFIVSGILLVYVFTSWFSKKEKK